MKIIRSKEFRASRPWGALDIANMRGITTRLHWTDEPYHWHVNDGEEVFAVLDGRIRSSSRRATCSSPRWARSTWRAPSGKRASPSSKQRAASDLSAAISSTME